MKGERKESQRKYLVFVTLMGVFEILKKNVWIVRETKGLLTFIGIWQ